MTTQALVTPASVSMLLAMVDMAKRRRYDEGVIGVLADPGRTETQDLTHDGRTVHIRPAESALAVREALLEHAAGHWTVIVTDRDDQDLGAGILAHLVGNRLQRPDPWEALRQAFAASGVSASLSSAPGGRALAGALMAARPAEGWPPAPAGVLTRAHAMASVARGHLELAGDVMDAITVLNWSIRPQSADLLATLRATQGDALADAVVSWVGDSTGAAEPSIRKLLDAGSVQDLVPMGLVLRLVTSDVYDLDDGQVATMARVRLEPTLGQPLPSRASLVAHAAAAVAVLDDLARTERNDAHVSRVLARADAIAASLGAATLTVHSDVLPSGFTSRLRLLAEALRRGISLRESGQPLDAATSAIERAWTLCARHRLGSRGGAETVAFEAAVRLWRWLSTPHIEDGADVVRRAHAHIDDGAWADLAVNDVDLGVDDAELTEALHAVYAAATARRVAEERAFAARLASDDLTDLAGDAGRPPVWPLETLVPAFVLPAARQAPVLFIVMDGMSAAAANEIVADATERLAWVEAGAVAGADRRAAALAVLPSVTEVSRASLLCGALRAGGQDVERAGYAELTERGAKITAALFHKKGIDTTRPGALVADGVGAAIDDIEGTPLVTVVLNTIDDALDRSDPMGTVWNADAIKHLSPILARARAAGRIVVLTADHGHVVERRRGVQRSAPDMTSGRSRGLSTPAQEDEVEVEGARVLTDTGRAVLAVDEGLRYGPLKAGYHGGGSAQEVVVPVVVLLPDDATNPLGLPLLAPQTPTWWSMAESSTGALSAVAPAPVVSVKGRVAAQSGPTLFDEDPGDSTPSGPTLGALVVANSVYGDQRKLLSRLPIRDIQVSALLDALARAAGQRLPRVVVASTLGVPAFRVDGALSQIRQLLNVEGYEVIGLDPDGQTVVLDERLLREQFEVP